MTTLQNLVSTFSKAWKGDRYKVDRISTLYFCGCGLDGYLSTVTPFESIPHPSNMCYRHSDTNGVVCLSFKGSGRRHCGEIVTVKSLEGVFESENTGYVCFEDFA